MTTADAPSPEDRGRLRRFFSGNEMIKHVLQLMSGTVLAQIVVMALMPFLSRLYSTAEFGVLAAFTSIVALISAVATLRYDMAVMLPKSDRDAAVLKSSATLIAFGTSLVTTALCVILARPLAAAINAPEGAPWFMLVGLGAFTLAEISALTYWLNRKSRYGAMATNRVLQSSATSVAQLALSFIRPLGAGGLILGLLGGQLISIIALRRRAKDLRGFLPARLSERRALLVRYRRMPLWNAPTALVDAVRLNGINLVIAGVSISALGQFSMAWRMVEIPAALIGSALAQVFFQRLSLVPPGEMTRTVLMSVRRSALFGIIPFAMVFIFSPWLFPFVFGDPWVDSGLYAQALTPWLFMNLITSPISTMFVVTERQYISLLFSIVYTVVPLSILVIFGSVNLTLAVYIMGAAMAVLLGVFILLALVVARRYDKHGSGPEVSPI